MDSLVFRDGEYSIYRSVNYGNAYFTAKYEHRLLTSKSEEQARLACIRHRTERKKIKIPTKLILYIGIFEIGFLIALIIDKLRGSGPTLPVHPSSG